MDPNACETSSVEDLLQNVSSALAHHRSVFAIEGHIESQQKLTIRWDARIKGFARTLRLPLTADATQESLGLLLNACQPATFGFGNQEVLDEEYRKAGKMDPNDFCTDFNPYEHGIVDTINQALAQGSHSAGKGLGVKAELYKLNVYSAPSGKFKPHVDTPRSDRQMGSLVVCLPVAHKGMSHIILFSTFSFQLLLTLNKEGSLQSDMAAVRFSATGHLGAQTLSNGPHFSLTANMKSVR